ncbi:uncharacterized protein LOC132207348 [Stegostoma tigrinum]|uniref:uncharacterized protein LOC132207348 n=1 Tax=Stegostoma tigrinum TaxID=3053191 RepID=UPI00286FCE67|nr:uncharacterized protein LOC132207348 [Stegostoma tigrinum]
MSQYLKTPWSLQSSSRHDNDENFIPFVTSSRTVSRYEGEAERRPQCSAAARNWADSMNPEDSLEHTVPHWMEVYEETPLRLLSSHVAQRPRDQHDLDHHMPSLRELPSPKELYGRRKGKRRLPSERQALSVLYHLEELKRRQAGIDQLKALRWSAERSQCQTQDGEQLEGVRPEDQLTVGTSIGDCLTNTDLEDRELFFQPQWKFGVPDHRLILKDTPNLAFYRTEAQENSQPFSFLTEMAQEDRTFWNVKHCAEE